MKRALKRIEKQRKDNTDIKLSERTKKAMVAVVAMDEIYDIKNGIEWDCEHKFHTGGARHD